MDFTNRNTQHQTVEPVAPGINVKRPSSNNKQLDGKWNRIGIVIGLIAVVILLIAVIIFVASNNKNDNKTTEASYIKTSKLQAVFLNTGQVYFGNLQTLNNSYFVLSNIYYLQTSSSSSASTTTTSNSNVTLVKLGCELHRPYDQMVINRAQVTFWENLQAGGQVAQAVAKYQTENPKHTCVDQSSSAATSTGSAAQNAGSGTTTTKTQ